MAMVQETKIIFDLSEITAFRLKCFNANCAGEILLPLRDATTLLSMPVRCPVCDGYWKDALKSKAANELLRVFQVLKQSAPDGETISIRLEIDAPTP